MVCIPCIVIPVVLWFFYKYIQPLILKFWNPWANKSVAASSVGGTGDGVSVESAKSPEYKYIQQKIAENKVMVFSKTTCPYCDMAKKVLNEVGVQYCVEEIDSRSDTGKLQDIFSELTGARTVPRVFIGGKCIGGGSETWSLHNQGLLLPMLEEAGATFKKTE